MYCQEIAEYYQSSLRPSKSTFDFECGLDQFIKIGLPATKTLAWLEAVDATAADVFILWYAMVVAVKDILDEPENTFNVNVKEQIIGIINSRSDQLFGAGKQASLVYRSAAYLNPC